MEKVRCINPTTGKVRFFVKAIAENKVRMKQIGFVIEDTKYNQEQKPIQVIGSELPNVEPIFEVEAINEFPVKIPTDNYPNGSEIKYTVEDTETPKKRGPKPKSIK